MFSLLKKNKWFFALALLGAAAVRVFFVFERHLVDGDSLIYGEIANNWLTHGIFGLTTDFGIQPTYIRLPGYPAFLAAIWRFTGVDHWKTVMAVQVFFDLGTCFIVADLTRRVVSRRAAKIAFALAAFCPFIAIYVAAPLTETLAVFFAALALDLAAAASDELSSGRLRYWIGCGLAVAAGILLRPDGGILLGAIGLYLIVRIVATRRVPDDASGGNVLSFRRHAIVAGLVLASVALAPLAPWAIRNWRDFHRFQPVAPRYANGPDEPVNEGFQRWVRTWMVDYISVIEVYWVFPGEKLDVGVLPSRAFDSEPERQATSRLFDEYNKTFDWTPELDAELAKIADARVKRHPIRYYAVLPALRIADIWMRPRIELMRTSDRWWNYQYDPHGVVVAVIMGLINLILVGSAAYAIFRRRNLRYVGLLLIFVLVRSLFLGSLENPETRYTLECYPVVFAMAAAAFAGRKPETNDLVAEELAHTQAQA